MNSQAAAAAAPGDTCPKGDKVKSSDIKDKTKKSDCDLSGRIIVDDGGPSVKVPEPGETVYAEALMPEGGTSQEFQVETAQNGDVLLTHQGLEDGSEASHEAPVGNPVDDACDQSAYTFGSSRWDRAQDWRFKASTSPGYLGVSATTNDIVNGGRRMHEAYNPCGRADNISALGRYLGTTTLPSGIDTDGACLGNNSENIVDFGTLGNFPGGIPLAVACRFSSNGIVTNADVKFEANTYPWFTGGIQPGCSGRYSVEAVMVHESGHTWGLGHVSESLYPNLTMSTGTAPCDRRPVSLALGDLLGMESNY